VDLRVLNPNHETIRIEGVDFVLRVNGARLTRGLGNEAVDIPPLGDVLVNVTATTTLMDMIQQILRVADAEAFSWELEGRVLLRDSLRWLSFQGAGEWAPAGTL
jgi:LEA14-like dessication related protein